MDGESASPTPCTRLISPPGQANTKSNICGTFAVFMLSKLLSLAAALPFGAAWAGDEPPVGQEVVLGPTASCPSSIPVSCRNTTAQRDLCCFEAPGVSAIQGERITVLMSRLAGSSATDPGELTISSEHNKGANEANSSGIQTPAQDLRTHGPYTGSGLTSESHTLLQIWPLH